MKDDVENKKHTTVLDEIANPDSGNTIRRNFIRKSTVSRITVKKDKIVGFCKYPLHRGWLLRVIAEEHQCYYKKCPFLQRVEDNPYWQECASNAEKKRKRKKEIKKKQEARNLKAAKAEVVLENIKNRATKLAQKKGYEIIITRAGLVPNKGNLHVINYVSDKTENDYADYMSICDQLRAEFHCPFILLKVKKPNGDYCTIDEWLDRNPESKENIGIIPSTTDFYDIEEWLKAEEEREAERERKDAFLQECAEYAQEEADKTQLNIIVTRILERVRPTYTKNLILYISDKEYDDSDEYSELCSVVAQKTGNECKMVKAKDADGSYLTAAVWEEYSKTDT